MISLTILWQEQEVQASFSPSGLPVWKEIGWRHVAQRRILVSPLAHVGEGEFEGVEFDRLSCNAMFQVELNELTPS